MGDEEIINSYSHEKKEKEVVLGQNNYKIKKVIKRDGRIVEFDRDRIKYAIRKGNESCWSL
ncbi:ATP cone domain-containing protein [Candidatus Nanopusillus massiliensis]|uniref:ATP cone domain-containing protein n=1 Tax=Candidatus Nanopusillus massiliensis TaxID=2897163 RepID=UPI001E597D89|nr:ATP cone domain-containing protein [Candidatus Nanopusillus massiliensis]